MAESFAFDVFQYFAISQRARFSRVAAAGKNILLIKINQSSVIVGFGIIRFKANGRVEVFDGSLILTEFTINNPSVVVGIGIIGFKADGFIVVFDGHLILAEFGVNIPPVVISLEALDIAGLQTDSFVVVFDGHLILAKFNISNSPVDVCIGIIRFQADGLVIMINSFLNLSFV